MKARIKIYCTGRYGKAGEQIVDLKKVEYFKNGRINQAATLRNGYDVCRNYYSAIWLWY